jgi:hypothetical protein
VSRGHRLFQNRRPQQSNQTCLVACRSVCGPSTPHYCITLYTAPSGLSLFEKRRALHHNGHRLIAAVCADVGTCLCVKAGVSVANSILAALPINLGGSNALVSANGRSGSVTRPTRRRRCIDGPAAVRRTFSPARQSTAGQKTCDQKVIISGHRSWPLLVSFCRNVSPLRVQRSLT